MALDIHKLEAGRPGQLLFQIDETAYSALEPAFRLFYERIGFCIDPYGDMKFGSGLGTLIAVLTEYRAASDLKSPVIYERFLQALESWEENGVYVVFVGD